MQRTLRRAPWLLLLAFSLGCSTPIGSFGLISNHDIGHHPDVVAEGLKGESCVYHGLGFIPIGGMWNPSPTDALQAVLDQAPDGNVLTNVSITNYTLYTILYAKICLRVEADVEKIR